jgi:hypothetical protein
MSLSRKFTRVLHHHAGREWAHSAGNWSGQEPRRHRVCAGTQAVPRDAPISLVTFGGKEWWRSASNACDRLFLGVHTSAREQDSGLGAAIARATKGWRRRIWASLSSETGRRPKPRTDLTVWQKAALISALRDPVLAGYAQKILFEPMPCNAWNDALGGPHVRSL